MAPAENPTENTDVRMIAIGWMKLSASEPGRLKMSPPPKLGELLREQAAVHDRPELRPELRVDDRQEEPPDGERGRHHRQLDPLRAPGLPEERAVHGAASS